VQLGALVTEAGLDLASLRAAPVAGAGGAARNAGDGVGGAPGETDVTSITMDSRQVRPGSLFVCVPGRGHDGHDFAAQAVADGATALVVERMLDLPAPQVLVTSSRQAVGPLADAFFAHPSSALRVVGVTGTNGKTTTVGLLQAVLEAHGWPTKVIGTLTQARTTPEAPELHAGLAAWRDEGGRAVAMEVSSHALDQRRIDAVHFAAAVFTNLTQDHLDYHPSMNDYFEAKARLFEPGRADVAVINRDDPWGRRLLERLASSGLPAEPYGLDDATDAVLSAGGTTFRWQGQQVHLALPGRFNVANALAAATAARALGVPAATIAEGLRTVARVPGRFEPVDAGQPFTVLVDYAHTPDGLVQALSAARELGGGQLIVVFGAGGDRDHAKRPLMGEAVARLADLGIVTSDNPRTEDPGAIIADVLAGAEGVGRLFVQADRAEAIAMAVATAGPDDVVVIAGKGHEHGQDIGGRVLPFDDAAVARTAIERVMRSRPGEGSGPPAGSSR
jgi:UDP-N-acetylmuramoyl-L-alanyl-D-glutamate--2,6-diaminopimelate ligase